jgi:hypothetical protein
MAAPRNVAEIAHVRAYNDVLNTLGNIHDPRLADDTPLTVLSDWVTAMKWDDDVMKYFEITAKSYTAWAQGRGYAMSENALSAAYCLPQRQVRTRPVRNGEVAIDRDEYLRCCNKEGNGNTISHLKVSFRGGLGKGVTFDRERGLLYMHGGKRPAWFNEANLNPCWLDTTIQAIQGCGISHAQLRVAKDKLHRESTNKSGGVIAFPMGSLAQQEEMLEKMAEALQTDWADDGVDSPGRRIRRDLNNLINPNGQKFWAPTDAWEKATFGVEKVEMTQDVVRVCPNCKTGVVAKASKTRRQTQIIVGTTLLDLNKGEIPFVTYRSSNEPGKRAENIRYRVSMATLCSRLLVSGGLMKIGKQQACSKCGCQANLCCSFAGGPPEILCIETLDFGITGAEKGIHELDCFVLEDDGNITAYKVPYRWKLGIYCNGTGRQGNHFRYFEAASHRGDQVELGFYDDMMLDGAKLTGIIPDDDEQPIPDPWHTRAVILIFERVPGARARVDGETRDDRMDVD